MINHKLRLKPYNENIKGTKYLSKKFKVGDE